MVDGPSETTHRRPSFEPAAAIGLDDFQLGLVMGAAAAVPLDRRKAFVGAVVERLAATVCGRDELGPGLIHRAIRETLPAYFDPPNLGTPGKYA